MEWKKEEPVGFCCRHRRDSSHTLRSRLDRLKSHLPVFQHTICYCKFCDIVSQGLTYFAYSKHDPYLDSPLVRKLNLPNDVSPLERVVIQVFFPQLITSLSLNLPPALTRLFGGGLLFPDCPLHPGLQTSGNPQCKVPIKIQWGAPASERGQKT